MVFADPQVTSGNTVPQVQAARAAEFERTSCPLSRAQLESVLKVAFGHSACWSNDGAIHFVCTSWHQLPRVLAIGNEIYGSFENLCVWTKSDPGMAAFCSLYRPQHELVCVFKVGEGAPIHNLGRRGPRRSDVWEYPSPKTSKCTSKPVAMIADAIRDFSNRDGVILDPFGGCGTTLIAAQQTARRSRLIELDPNLVDLSIERWQRLTGDTARHAESGRAFVRNNTGK
jgi:hypothetical protein